MYLVFSSEINLHFFEIDLEGIKNNIESHAYLLV